MNAFKSCQRIYDNQEDEYFYADDSNFVYCPICTTRYCADEFPAEMCKECFLSGKELKEAVL